MKNTIEDAKTFVELFREEYPHIHIDQLPLEKVRDFLNQPHVANAKSIKWQLNLAWDWCLSQQLCDVQE